jgi:hypothetical protein
MKRAGDTDYGERWNRTGGVVSEQQLRLAQSKDFRYLKDLDAFATGPGRRRS